MISAFGKSIGRTSIPEGLRRGLIFSEVQMKAGEYLKSEKAAEETRGIWDGRSDMVPSGSKNENDILFYGLLTFREVSAKKLNNLFERYNVILSANPYVGWNEWPVGFEIRNVSAGSSDRYVYWISQTPILWAG